MVSLEVEGMEVHKFEYYHLYKPALCFCASGNCWCNVWLNSWSAYYCHINKLPCGLFSCKARLRSDACQGCPPNTGMILGACINRVESSVEVWRTSWILMDGKEQALGDRKSLYLITSRCSFILVLLYSINMFINYRFLVILQACMMFFCVTFTYILIQAERSALFFCLEEETCKLVFLFNTKEVRNV